MTSERIRRRIEQLLDEADQAMTRLDWTTVRDRASAVLAADPENIDAKAYLEMAARGLAGDPPAPPASEAPSTLSPAAAQPDSFASGRYVVRRFLGEGGKKKVYLAHDARLDRDVAFALIKTEGLDEAARERITREAQAMGRLGNHPNIVTVYDIGDEAGQPFLVLPVLEGGDVEGLIEKAPEHRLPLDEVVRIGVDTCEGLEFLHAKGLIHRDVKPGNTWLTNEGRAMIGDFGLAVAVDRSRLTQAGMMVGTVSYMAPEQAMGGEVTPRADLYALGAMLYEMVCGRPPFVGDESVAIIGQHLNTPPVAPTWHRPDCPAALEALILRLLEKDPQKRPSSAAEVRDALKVISISPLPREGEGKGEGAASRTSTTAQSSAADPLYRTVFVGRETELKQLQGAFDAAVSGQGGLVMVVGEPGIGKTAVCQQLATYVSLRGGRTLVGHCYEEGSLSLPYLAFVEAMRTYVLARDPDGLKSDLGSGAADVARIVSEVRDRVAVELRDAGDPEDDRWRLLQSLTTFLRNAASVQPLCIVLEDLHWADRGTLDLLQHVARNLQGARLVVVGTYRDVEVDRAHPLSGALAELRRSGSFLRVPLRGLTVDEVHRMYETLRGQDVAWAQAEAVHRQTEGNPLFVQEVLRYLVEEGIVVRQGDRYVAQQPGQGVPEGLRDVIGRRLSHLGEKTNTALSVASVIGRDFRLDVLQKVAGLGEDDLFAALEEAQERAIIEQVQSPAGVAFRFTHAMFRTLLYEEIFAPRRIRLHQQVGRALEETHVRRLEEHAAEMAEHFSQSTEAADLEKAVRYGELAAQRAMGVFAYGEAVRHLEQALRAQEVLDPEDRARRCDLLLQLARAQLPLGEPRRVIENVAEPAYTLAEAAGDGERAANVALVALEALLRENNSPTTVGSPQYKFWLERMEQFAQAGSVYEAVSLISRGRGSRRVEGLREGIDLAKQLGSWNLAYEGGWLLLLAYLTPEHRHDALAVVDEIEALPRTGVDLRNQSMFLQFAACARLLDGDRDAYDSAGKDLEQLAERTRDTNVVLSAEANRALRMILAGELDAALSVSLEAIAFGHSRSAGSVSPIQSAMQAASYLGRESEVRASDFPDGSPLLRSWVLSVLGEPPADLLVSADLRELLEHRIFVDSGAQARMSIMTVAVKRGFEDIARTHLDAFEAGDAAFTAPAILTSVRRHCADAELQFGKPDRARELYEQAIADCAKIRHRPELALSHLGLAELLLEHYPDERDAAIEHLDFAIGEFREMKMQPALERALRHRGLLKA